MKYLATEYVQIDLDNEVWECRTCDHTLGSARENYKIFTKIYNRNPQEIHRPKLDPTKYEFTFSPNPKVCAIYEFYCPNCGTMMDVEYTVPGALPLHDFELDIDALKEKMQGRTPVVDAGEGVDTTQALREGAHDHSCSHDKNYGGQR
ncbi:MAG: acetone carboxylase subunit gamma [Cellvibrionaceae bacterium]|nr:acetone carboxylase subunit gamma [Cellvibrionaceae bacterium]|tara:strand:+ start:11059 stop:11502 length:444 start_codon:yes stop_codon:yes gene_type:complete